MEPQAEGTRRPARRLFGSVSGGDAGYDETAKMVSEAALTLLHLRPLLTRRLAI